MHAHVCVTLKMEIETLSTSMKKTKTHSSVIIDSEPLKTAF